MHLVIMNHTVEMKTCHIYLWPFVNSLLLSDNSKKKERTRTFEIIMGERTK